jgi:hypothetical protein
MRPGAAATEDGPQSTEGLKVRRGVYCSELLGIVFRAGIDSCLFQEAKHPGPMEDASLSPRQSPPRLTELAFGVSHTPAPDLVKLWIVVHAGSQT